MKTAMQQATAKRHPNEHALYDMPFNDAVPFGGEEPAPWELLPTEQPVQQQQQQPVNGAPIMNQSIMLQEFFGPLGHFPRTNVMEKMIQLLISESARAEHFADRVEYGDDAYLGLEVELDAAGFPTKPIDSQQRPSPDTDGSQPRLLTEKQMELVDNLRSDQVQCLDMAADLVDCFRELNGDNPVYGIRQNASGRWDRITDIHAALGWEYARAHAGWLKKQAVNADAEAHATSKAGEELRKQQQSKRAQALSRF